MDSQQQYIRVEDTNSEALQQKISAIHQGYMTDDFAVEFVRPQGGRKDVIIHRGYWCRSHIFMRIVKSYLQNIKGTPIQVISLGCGYDTLAFQLLKELKDVDFHYYEIDLPQVAMQKVKKIEKSKLIGSLFTESPLQYDQKYRTVDSKKYTLFGQDICNLEEMKENLNSFKIDYSQPTLVFAECVLTYIEAPASQRLLEWLSNSFKCLTFLNYEMFNGKDQFGQMMIKNFDRRGCPLVGLDAFPSLQAHSQRLQGLGFKGTEIYDMKTLYRCATDSQERERIEKIEFLDEWEEWNLIQSHYLVSLSHNFIGINEIQQSIIDQVKLSIK